jgi:aspartate oxidase
MIGAIQRYIEQRRAIARDADSLMETMRSLDAWHEARSRGRDFLLSQDERTHWWRVAALIEARASIHRSTVGSSFAPPI